ncbi:MAG: DUF4287 domain-containing protein [Bryobacterales bacterium]|nr:DUF4287 domain-containing protein [Bryobacterales bacterium]
MDAVEKALATQIANIEKKTGKSLPELAAILRSSGLEKHGELREFAKSTFGLGHGDANTLVHASAGKAESDEIYVGPKAHMRPIHDLLLQQIGAFGQFEVAPKKGYVSLRRKKQFAMIGPATNTRFEVGLNMKGVAGGGRLEELPPKGMCSHKVKLTSAEEVDGELLGWIRAAFDQAG